MFLKIKSLLIRSVYHRRLPLWTAAFAMVSVLFSHHVYSAIQPMPDDLEAIFLDVGQGDAIYVRAPNGNSMLVDGGPSSGHVTSKISESKNIFDRHIDVVMATHADADHIGGLEGVMRNFSSSLYLDPAYLGKTETYKSLIAALEERNVPRLVARKGLRVILDDDRHVALEILYPSNDYPVKKYRDCEIEKKQNKRKSRKKCEKLLAIDTNESSIVARLTYGSSSVMLTGDAPIEVEHFLMNTLPKNALASTGLKVGHHGSKTSTSADFLEAVHPQYAVISSGLGNRYGHPHEQVMKIIRSSQGGGVKILRTDESGTVKIKINAGGMVDTTQ